MLIEVDDGTIINTDQVRSIKKMKADDNNPSGAQAAVIWTDGKRQILNCSYQRLLDICGHVVPVPPGYFQIEAYAEGDKVDFFATMPVIAFRIGGANSYDVTPVTIEGEATFNEWGGPRAIIFPDGRVYEDSDDGRLPMSLDEWKADVTKRLQHPKS